MDTVVYNGEVFEIESGLTEADIRESMKQIFASAAHAKITKVETSTGKFTHTFTESGGGKGLFFSIL